MKKPWFLLLVLATFLYIPASASIFPVQDTWTEVTRIPHEIRAGNERFTVGYEILLKNGRQGEFQIRLTAFDTGKVIFSGWNVKTVRLETKNLVGSYIRILPALNEHHKVDAIVAELYDEHDKLLGYDVFYKDRL